MMLNFFFASGSSSPPQSTFFPMCQILIRTISCVTFISLWGGQCSTPYSNKVKVKSLSRVRLFATPWTVACTRFLLHQAPPSMGFSRQEYWSGLPFPSPGNLPTQGPNPDVPHCRGTLYHLSHQGSPKKKKNPLCRGLTFNRSQRGS